jgi:predicted GIY-YIG superfamily endonuclease
MQIIATYILECADKSLYVGSTLDLDKRIEEHNIGTGANYTSKRRPVKLVYFEWYDLVVDAYNRENQIKKWSRAKKIALINGDKEKLKQLSKKRGK